jgi:DNA-directed RNA polymerase III subunit RPC3
MARATDLTWVFRDSWVGHERMLTYIKRDLVVRVNYDKCTVALRNQKLVSLAANRIGEMTSRVYAALLQLLENRIRRCQLDPNIDDLGDDDEGPSVSTMELARALSKSIDPSTGIGKVDSKSISTGALEKPQKKRKRKFDEFEATVEGEASSDEDEDEDEQEDSDHIGQNGNIYEVDHDSDSLGEDSFPDPFTSAPALQPPRRPTKVTFDDEFPRPENRDVRMNRMTSIKNHLLILADYSPPLVRKCGSGGLGEWTVDFDEIIKSMQENEMDSIIRQRFGVVGSRIVKILKQKGKLEEKQIQKFGLMKMKDIRTKLVALQMSGFAEIQEVPRDTNRAALRMMFFWFYDPDRARMIVLEHLYKTMSRCIQVLKAEKHEERDILAQAERTDIRGQEAEFLPPDRLERLQWIRDKEKKIFTQIGRLDEMVAIFKDF